MNFDFNIAWDKANQCQYEGCSNFGSIHHVELNNGPYCKEHRPEAWSIYYEKNKERLDNLAKIYREKFPQNYL